MLANNQDYSHEPTVEYLVQNLSISVHVIGKIEGICSSTPEAKMTIKFGLVFFTNGNSKKTVEGIPIVFLR